MKRITAIVIALIALFAGGTILIAYLGKKPTITDITTMKEAIRFSSFDDETYKRISIEICELTNLLAHASSQREYDELLPLLLERNTKRGGLDWVEFVNRDLAKGPVLKMLSREADDFAFAASAWVAGALDFQEATPLLIDYMTQRYAGRDLPENSHTDVICACRALARFAYRGNKQAAEFLIGHSKKSAWNNIAFKKLSGRRSLNTNETVDFMWSRACGALLYYPCEDSIKALNECGYEHADKFAYLIQSYLQSGDSYGEYWEDVNAKGELSNKYMANAPSWVTSTKPVSRIAVSTNAQMAESSRMGRVNKVQVSVSTNSSPSVR